MDGISKTLLAGNLVLALTCRALMGIQERTDRFARRVLIATNGILLSELQQGWGRVDYLERGGLAWSRAPRGGRCRGEGAALGRDPVLWRDFLRILLQE
jgi:hypothetical protein